MAKTLYDFPLDPAPRCPACGSMAGARNGCCAVCYCPSIEHQEKMSGQRGIKFMVLDRLRAMGQWVQSTGRRDDDRPKARNHQ